MMNDSNCIIFMFMLIKSVMTLQISPTFMSVILHQDQGRSLPKFGEWDVNNPASAEGYTVIFSKARDEKKSPSGAGRNEPMSQRNNNASRPEGAYPPMKKRWCCF
ncbi:hypothetical protein BT93_E1570 [Corymbia citriodora subsp. variegata]|nr:hypothetical protein BT93_E1570 [Corymbia citriodora subsp. variegata]